MNLSLDKKINYLAAMSEENNFESSSNNEDNIHYSKYNPFIFKKNWSGNKKFNNWYLVIKLCLVVLIAIFGMLSLWYVAQWEKNTLVNLGVDLSKYTDISIGTEDLNLLNTLGLSEFDSTKYINSGLLNVLLAFSLIGVIFIIPTLIFKNGTAWSIGSMIFTFICLVITLVILFMGIIDQQRIVSIYKSDIKKDPIEGAAQIIELIKKGLISTTP